MNPFALATTLITLQRATSYVLDSVAFAASLTPSRQPASASRLLLHATGSPSGNVTITGTVGGVSDTEVLSWSGSAGTRVSVKPFSAVTGFTSTVTGGTALYAQAVGAGGQPDANRLTTITTGYPASVIQKNQPGWRGLAPGHEPEGDAVAKVPYAETFTPTRGDLLTTDQSETYEVVSVELRGGGLRPADWIVMLQRRQGRG